MIPSYFGNHLSFASDILGFPLPTYRQIHAATGAMSILLGILHSIFNMASKTTLNLFNASGQLFCFIVKSRFPQLCFNANPFFQAFVSTSFLILQTVRLFQLPSYELFLRSHQVAALVTVYALWKHTTFGLKLPGLYVYISAGIFLIMFLLQCLVVIYRNFGLGGRHSRVLISKHRGTVRMSIDVPKPLKIRAGQYVNIWIPSVSLLSFIQSHPFTIAF